MRVIDKNRLIAMNEIEMRSDSIHILARQFERTYNDETYSSNIKMEVLDDLWRLITEHQIRLTEILRENGL